MYILDFVIIMSKLNELIDKIAIREILSFFVLVVLILTLITVVLDVHMESNTFKVLAYGIVLIFFINKFRLSLSEIKEESSQIFNSVKFSQIIFIISTNLLIVMALYFIISYLSNFHIFSFLKFINNVNLYGSPQNNIFLIAIEFLATVILAPIVEELIFRGVILRKLAGMSGITVAILLSSILFGLGHSLGGIFSAFLFGICMSILYIKSDNIFIPIFAHFLNNLISFLFIYCGFYGLIIWSTNLVLVISLIALIFGIILFRGIILEWPKSLKN